MIIGRDSLGRLAEIRRREWLVTNGIGGFAAGTVGLVNTRRYHGLLVAALRPPVERTVMVSKLDLTVRYAGVSARLSTNEYADGTIDPQGFCLLDSFRLEGLIPVWTWVVGDALLEQRIWMAHGLNTTYVSFKLLLAATTMSIHAQPLCVYRDYHSHHRGAQNFELQSIDGGLQLTAYPGAMPYRILHESGDCRLDAEWHWNFKHRVESERGLDDVEDLFRPAVICLELEPGDESSVVFSAEPAAPQLSSESLARERRRQHALKPRASVPAWIEQLHLAADQYIVERRDANASVLGQTIIAGYPWFSDWGRDTMIALPGLTLATGRHDVAASILRTFARFVSEGMLPNRFPDAGDAPEYNTVDATLWYFVAVDEYLRKTGDESLRADLYPVLQQIVASHLRGTRYGIKADANDGLLFAGERGVQLTWMDAKVGDWVVTPRIGKCVEINALWFNALMIMSEMAVDRGDSSAAATFAMQAARVKRSFNERFWFEGGGHLYDVIDGPEESDASLRPNQLFAVSLRHGLLDQERARAVVERCSRDLWTPVGLRSLSPEDPRFVTHYRGGPWERDGAYHQGTVWSWLLGPFAMAHYRVYGDAGAARSRLTGIAAHLREACVGQVSEIFDAEAPFAPRGCFAQAWGVAEILRAWSEINESELEAGNGARKR